MKSLNICYQKLFYEEKFCQIHSFIKNSPNDINLTSYDQLICHYLCLECHKLNFSKLFSYRYSLILLQENKYWQLIFVYFHIVKFQVVAWVKFLVQPCRNIMLSSNPRIRNMPTSVGYTSRYSYCLISYRIQTTVYVWCIIEYTSF